MSERTDWQARGNDRMTREQQKLREQVDYDESTGAFTWRVSGRGRFKRAGAPAGSRASRGYLRLCVEGLGEHYAHRLAWLYVTGEWPPEQIDHINGDRSDNRISNLRACSLQENRRNTIGIPTRRKYSRFKGVTKDKYGRWCAQITRDGVGIRLGPFDTEEAAASAYREKAKEVHGEFARWA